MNKELMEALAVLEKEKDISREVIMEAIENSLLTACKNHFGKADNIHVHMDRETGDYEMYAEKTVVETVTDPALEISLEDAQKANSLYQIGDTVRQDIRSASFGRIATQNAKNVILQKLREEERKSVFDRYYSREHQIITGVVQRHIGKNININLGKADAIMPENEQVKSENYRPTERIKVLILEVKDTPRGPHILVSRTHPDLIRRLLEIEVPEIYDGVVRSIMPYGCFVEILPGKDGLLHISEIDWKRLETVEEAGIKEGDHIQVKLLEIDPKTGKYKLSHRVLIEKPEGYVERPARRERGERNGERRNDRGDRRERGGDRGDRRGGDRRQQSERHQRPADEQGEPYRDTAQKQEPKDFTDALDHMDF